MVNKKSLFAVMLVGLLSFGLTGCDDDKAQMEVQKHKAAAETALQEAVEMGVKEWTPSQYEAAQARYQNAVAFAEAKQYEDAKYELDQFYQQLEIAKNDTKLAQEKAEMVAQQRNHSSQETYTVERQKMLKDIQALQNMVNEQKSQIAQHESEKEMLVKEAMEKAAMQAASSSQKYTVQKGDTLIKIASRPDIYNNGQMWGKLWELNKTKLKSTRQIYPGQVLTVR